MTDRNGCAECAELRRENERLRKALRDAIEAIEAWGSYASDYFKDKHDFDGDVARARAALEDET